MAPLLRKKENVIFHLNYSTQIKLGMEVRKRFNIRLIYTLHYLPNYFSSFATKTVNPEEVTTTGDVLDREIALEAGHIICVTKFAKQMLNVHYSVPKEKMTVIYNGCSQVNYNSKTYIDNRQLLKTQLGFSATGQIILFVGRLKFGKGVEKLVSTFNRLSENNQDLKLVLVGSGDFNPFLELCQNNFGRVTFTGKLPKKQVIQLYRIADIGVIPSEFEQCSYVALEMMQHGLPIIATEAPGLKELFTHNHDAIFTALQKREDGLLGLEVDENSLYHALKQLTSNKILQKKLSKNAQQKWEQNYTAKHMVQSTLKLYKQFFKPTTETIKTTETTKHSNNNKINKGKRAGSQIIHTTTASCPDSS
jgi:glycosyltransferase involved in cell wall biosynthesis